MKRYKITLPTKDQCKAMGLRFENQEPRIRLLLMGIAFGVSIAGECRFNLCFTSNTYFYVETNSITVLLGVKDRLAMQGCTVERVMDRHGNTAPIEEEKTITLTPV